jgi:predicted aspartyl protease
MVDTGAQYSVLNKPTEPLSQKISLVQGATGSKAYQWTSKCQVDLGQHQVTHSFLVIPECPAPLLGHDLLR